MSLETTVFFEKKLSVTPKELNELKTKKLDDILLHKAKETVENKCSENGFVLPGSITIISRSIGYFEAARFTGDSNYYVKLKGQVLYPADGMQLVGVVIRKNKMGLYANYKDAIHIQVPRDLHIGDLAYDSVEIGDSIVIELKRSKFAINDPFILSSGQFIQKADAVLEEVESVEVLEEKKEQPVINASKATKKSKSKVPKTEAPVEAEPEAEAPVEEEVPVEEEAEAEAPIESEPVEAPKAPVEAPKAPVEAPKAPVEVPKARKRPTRTLLKTP